MLFLSVMLIIYDFFPSTLASIILFLCYVIFNIVNICLLFDL